jgi:hypothetical protein
MRCRMANTEPSFRLVDDGRHQVHVARYQYQMRVPGGTGQVSTPVLP